MPPIGIDHLQRGVGHVPHFKLVIGRRKVQVGRRMVSQTLFNWVKAERLGKLRGVDTQVVSADQMEISWLHAELARMKMERDIPRKATAYFVKVRS